MKRTHSAALYLVDFNVVTFEDDLHFKREHYIRTWACILAIVHS
jgi:hypothetical protein